MAGSEGFQSATALCRPQAWTAVRGGVVPTRWEVRAAFAPRSAQQSIACPAVLFFLPYFVVSNTTGGSRAYPLEPFLLGPAPLAEGTGSSWVRKPGSRGGVCAPQPRSEEESSWSTWREQSLPQQQQHLSAPPAKYRRCYVLYKRAGKNL